MVGVEPVRRRALVVSHEASRTGAPLVAVEVLRALAAEGWSTTLLERCPGPLSPTMRELADRTMVEPFLRLRSVLRVVPLHPAKALADRIDRWVADRCIRDTDVDLVWCNTALCAPEAAAARRRGLPVVLLGHEEQSWAAASFARARLDLSDPRLTLLGCSTSVSMSLATLARRSPDEVCTLHPAVDVAAVRAASEPAPDAVPQGPVVLGCGTADHRKGVDVFCAAAAAAAELGIAATWLWVGRASEPPASEHVRFVGEVDRPAAWIGAADVVVVPSRWDAFPLVVLEAMALGRPLVVSDLPGPVEQVGDAAVVVPVEDPAAIARSVRALLLDRDAAAKLGARAERRCRELWDRDRFRTRIAPIAASSVLS